ncbi:hypothetical protein GTH52_13865 [Clostridium tyrobutyricum]|jgi:APA family basic amino acid/polyamine antiporter|uniref:Arginine permease RocE n=1 Tax=Clostridium tyrobutyricum DIVETGP TaxID=1408889 RepID=W6N1W5_CLOTY|nr:amino acid permease C-terminal domain-containing protein [Clostridium tyrobutyricum]CDL90278.1 Arginine permease RocE [Clostridium tyrobutyricum DIVETGP]AND85987.1 hypothetical protein CTK_C27450 [Clostridium tyrobutyricum]ANP70473.1 hypothetical protein BA182_12565 [Clostridium tyrobutyricum]MBV4414742.1 hypothetical protein [Clostridium tyrobutyricum]MBV4422347.1 hypothetical protein [Clostridium tyrobutyricum]
MPDIERKFKCSSVPYPPIISCIALLISMRAITWIGFIIWLVIRLIIYFIYGRKHSIVQNESKD